MTSGVPRSHRGFLYQLPVTPEETEEPVHALDEKLEHVKEEL